MRYRRRRNECEPGYKSCRLYQAPEVEAIVPLEDGLPTLVEALFDDGDDGRKRRPRPPKKDPGCPKKRPPRRDPPRRNPRRKPRRKPRK